MERGVELKNCTPIKTILMMMIVLYHSMRIFMVGGVWGPYPPVNEAPVLGYISEWLNSFHIYAFTLISGYIFCYIKYERGGYQKYFSFIINKTKRLLVPYLFSSVVWVAPVYAFYFGADGLLKNICWEPCRVSSGFS